LGLIAIALVLLAGAAVGATSIGGVLVVPVLTTWTHTSAEQAIAASSFGFAFTGAAAFMAPARTSGASARGHWPLHVCALFGAALGALTLAWLPGSAVKVGVGLLAVASGLYALFGTAAQGRRRAIEGGWLLAALGAVVGCASAWSGTGGPVLLLPLLTLLGWQPHAGVAAAQKIQLPVALAATGVHLAAGRLDLGLGLAVGGLVLAGWAAGRWLARHLDTRRLQQAVALALIAAGLWYL
jgi:uncharacterized membrane protein YfcA